MNTPTFRPDSWTWSIWHLYEGCVDGFCKSGAAATEHEAQTAALDAARRLA
jgi:hypothetical protein